MLKRLAKDTQAKEKQEKRKWKENIFVDFHEPELHFQVSKEETNILVLHEQVSCIQLKFEAGNKSPVAIKQMNCQRR